MRGSGGVAPFIPKLCAWSGWVVSFMPRPHYPPEKDSRYLLFRRLGEPQGRSGRWTSDKSLACGMSFYQYKNWRKPWIKAVRPEMYVIFNWVAFEEIFLFSPIEYNGKFIMYITTATCFGLFYRPSSGNTVHESRMYTAKCYLRARKFAWMILSASDIVAIKYNYPLKS